MANEDLFPSELIECSEEDQRRLVATYIGSSDTGDDEAAAAPPEMQQILPDGDIAESLEQDEDAYEGIESSSEEGPDMIAALPQMILGASADCDNNAEVSRPSSAPIVQCKVCEEGIIASPSTAGASELVSQVNNWRTLVFGYFYRVRVTHTFEYSCDLVLKLHREFVERRMDRYGVTYRKWDLESVKRHFMYCVQDEVLVRRRTLAELASVITVLSKHKLMRDEDGTVLPNVKVTDGIIRAAKAQSDLLDKLNSAVEREAPIRTAVDNFVAQHVNLGQTPDVHNTSEVVNDLLAISDVV